MSRRLYAISVKIWKWQKLLSSVPFIIKHFQIMFTFEFYHVDWPSQFYSEWRQTSKLVNLILHETYDHWSVAVLTVIEHFIYSHFWFFFQIGCFLHLIQSVYPHLFCSLYDNGSPLYWRFLLRSGYAILVKIWKWLKLLNSVQFIKKTLVNHVCIRIS